MQIIDRYLLRQFLQVFVICFCSLTGLFIVIDGFGNLEEFVTYSKEHGRSVLSVMGEYYAYRSLAFFDMMSGMLTLIAAMFTVTWIQRHNEIIALQAAGIPKRRIIIPVVIAAAGVSVVAMLNRDLAIPAVRNELSRNAQSLGGATGKKFDFRYDNATKVLIRGEESYADEKRIAKPSFLLPGWLDQYGRELVADNAVYEAATSDHPAGYRFKEVKQPRDLARLATLTRSNGDPVLITPKDAKWLAPNECFLASGVSFDQIEGGRSWGRYSSTWELIRSMYNPSLDYGSKERVTIHTRFVQPLLDITLLFLGLPLVLSRDSRNIFLAVGLCGSIVMGFMLVNLASQQLGNMSLLNASLAAWLPLMIFVPCAVRLTDPLLD